MLRLSKLQKTILQEALASRGQYSRRRIRGKVKIVTRSLERLIDRELLIGFGRRTPHKWFIGSIKLTAKGKKIAKKLLGEQLPLKLKIKK